MGQPAARLADSTAHGKPLSPGPGSTNVLIGGKPAWRAGSDFHVCPLFDGPKPHVGGPILPPGAPTVLIAGLPAATVGSMCTCVGPPDSIVMGSMKVMIGGKPAARMGDTTAHGGVIVAGAPTVMIN